MLTTAVLTTLCCCSCWWWVSNLLSGFFSGCYVLVGAAVKKSLRSYIGCDHFEVSRYVVFVQRCCHIDVSCVRTQESHQLLDGVPHLARGGNLQELKNHKIYDCVFQAKLAKSISYVYIIAY